MWPVNLFFYLLFLFLLTYYKKTKENNIIKVFIYSFLAFILMLICFGEIGIDSYLLIENYWLSNKSSEWIAFIKIDKFIYSLLIIFILGFQRKIDRSFNTKNLYKSLIYFLLSFLLIFLAMFMSYIDFDFKIDRKIYLFLINQFFVVFSEEVIFRRFIFGELYFNILSKKLFFVSVVFTNLMFAIIHLPNIPFAVLAFVAGILYTKIYKINRNIYSAFALHFFVNFIHFIFFTYPFKN